MQWLSLASRAETLLQRMLSRQATVLIHQLLLAFIVVWILGDTVDRADFYTLWCVVVADALCAFVGIYLVDFLTGSNGLVGTLWLADIAVDALVSDN